MHGKRRKITGALLALLLPLCGAKDCEKKESKPEPRPTATAPAIDRPNCPKVEWRAPEERCFTLQAFVESRLGPYDVYLKIEGGTGAYPRHIPVAAGGWDHAVVYATGKKLTITMTVHYEGTQSKDGFCSITDGMEFIKNKLRSITAGGGSPYEAVCVLTTSQ